jgi:hypothetical protein
LTDGPDGSPPTQNWRSQKLLAFWVESSAELVNETWIGDDVTNESVRTELVTLEAFTSRTGGNVPNLIAIRAATDGNKEADEGTEFEFHHSLKPSQALVAGETLAFVCGVRHHIFDGFGSIFHILLVFNDIDGILCPATIRRRDFSHDDADLNRIRSTGKTTLSVV